MLLFFNYFSLIKSGYNEKIITVDYTVDRFINTIDGRFSCSPLLNRDY